MPQPRGKSGAESARRPREVESFQGASRAIHRLWVVLGGFALFGCADSTDGASRREDSLRGPPREKSRVVRATSPNAVHQGGYSASTLTTSQGGYVTIPSGGTVASSLALEQSGSTGGRASTDTGAAVTESALPEPGLLIAFLGDQGLGASAEQVLELVKSEGADAVVHIGDFDYIDSPTRWLAQIDKVLGPGFPYFSVIGNHESAAWSGERGYGQIIAERQARIPTMRCVGEPGIKYACRFKGLGLVFSCVGSSEIQGYGDCSKDSPEQIEFIKNALRSELSPWKLCVWHKTRSDFQVGYKTDEVGMAAYDVCFSHRAIVANAHEHSYSRTYVLSNLMNRDERYGKIGTADRLEISPGQSFVFVSGLGGDSIRPYNPAHDSDTWFAAYHTSTHWLKSGMVRDGMNQYGALFIRFHVMGNPRQAWGYFKSIDARVLDEFTIVLAESNEDPP